MALQRQSSGGMMMADAPRDSDFSAPRFSLSELNQSDTMGRQVRIWLLSSVEMNGATYYRVAGRFTNTGQTWQVHRRYSEFLVLRNTLIKYFTHSDATCPGCLNYLHSITHFAFPKKHVFVSKSKLVVNYRTKALRSFLDMLASWAFSNSPKCPTCGGFAFDIVRNFVLEGADPVGESNMGNIRASFVVTTFTNADRRHSLVETRSSVLSRRNSHIPVSGSSTLLDQRRTQQRQNQSTPELLRRNTVDAAPGCTTGATAEHYATFNEFRGSQLSHKSKQEATRPVINTPDRKDKKESPNARSRPPPSSSMSSVPTASTRTSDRRRTNSASANQMAPPIADHFVFYHDNVSRKPSRDRGSTRGSMSHTTLRSDKNVGRKSTRASVLERTGSDSYISLTASNVSVDPEDYSEAMFSQHDSHHPSVMASPQNSASLHEGVPSKQSYSSRRYSSDRSSNGRSRYDAPQPVTPEDSDEEIDVTGVKLQKRRTRHKSTSGDNLWQPWELATAG